MEIWNIINDSCIIDVWLQSFSEQQMTYTVASMKEKYSNATKYFWDTSNMIAFGIAEILP